jgi:putative flippase GtrA
VLSALFLNEVVLVTVIHEGVPLMLASSAGIVTGAIFNFSTSSGVAGASTRSGPGETAGEGRT